MMKIKQKELTEKVNALLAIQGLDIKKTSGAITPDRHQVKNNEIQPSNDDNILLTTLERHSQSEPPIMRTVARRSLRNIASKSNMALNVQACGTTDGAAGSG